MKLQKKNSEISVFLKNLFFCTLDVSAKWCNNPTFQSEQTEKKSLVTTTCHHQQRLHCCERYLTCLASTWEDFDLLMKCAALFILNQYFICGLKVKRFLSFSPLFFAKTEWNSSIFFSLTTRSLRTLKFYLRLRSSRLFYTHFFS